MSILIPQSNKPKIVALLRELSREVIYQHLDSAQQAAVEAQCSWMASAESGDVIIQAGIASEPLTQTIEFKFSLRFTPGPVGKQP